MKRIMLAAALLLATAVQAEETMFYERPAFLAESMPLKIACRDTQPYFLTCYGDIKMPGLVKAKVVNTSGGNLHVQQVQSTYVATCSDGMCVNQNNQTPVGDVDFPQLKGHGIIVEVFEGYYLAKDEKGYLAAFKRGFGPQGDKYPPYAIYTEPNPASITARDSAADEVVKLNNPENQTYGNAEVWPVWCEAGKSTCNVAGQAKDKDALFKEMPMASWGYCQGDFCYGDESLTDVIGLNPAIHN